MPYEFFKGLVGALCSKTGKVKEVRFSESDGRYHAICDGIQFSGNNVAHRICIEWGSGHKAYYPQEV